MRRVASLMPRLLLAPLFGLVALALPAGATVVTLVAAGDIADCGTDGLQPPVAQHTAALVEPTDTLVLTLGDNAYPVGAPREFAGCFHDTWGRFGDRLRPAPGNHEYMTPGAAGYFDYFGERAGPDRRGWYSFDVGDWHVISLNSMADAQPGSAQYDWLEADLAANAGALCALAVFHHPVFSSAPRGNDPRMAAVFARLYQAGVELVLSGHDHVYERFAPQDPQGRFDERGVRSFTVGTGGARLYALRAARPNSEFRDNTTHGVLRLTLAPDGYRWEFVPVGGGPPRDSGDARCHR
jgi:3',5'-cyclic AMP phosphodiesterase CpdA